MSTSASACVRSSVPQGWHGRTSRHSTAGHGCEGLLLGYYLVITDGVPHTRGACDAEPDGNGACAECRPSGKGHRGKGGRQPGGAGDVPRWTVPPRHIIITWLLPMDSHTPGALVTQSLMVTGARAECRHRLSHHQTMFHRLPGWWNSPVNIVMSKW